MKKITLLISAIALVAFSAFAQSKPGKTVVTPTRTCGTMDMVSEEDMQNLQDYLAPKIAAYLQAQNNGGSPEAVYTIPTIVHIIHNTNESAGTGRNIPYARVTEQIQVLNDDYGRTNADASNTQSVFAAVAADCEVKFCLITRYPSGHPNAGQPLAEAGVDRVSTADISGISNTTSGYSTTTIDNTIKPATSWNPAEVMNIWVLQLQSGLLGYAQFPGQAANTDGTVMGYQYFGLTGGQFGLGRTTTHEIGHWLGLRHIWGDANCGNDFVSDTPTQQTSNYNCPSFPHVTCSNGPNGDMYQNYMDYVDDNCMNLFTAGQKAVMQSTLNPSSGYTNRKTLSAFSATLCAPISTANDDAGISAITTPSGTLCSGTITPVVVLKNFGGNALTSVTINYSVDGTPQTPYSWTGNLATNTTANVNLPSISVTAGAHTFDANTTMPNATTDQVPGNDAASQSSFNVISSGGAMPFSEGFEGTYLPTGWAANNPDGSTTWAKTTVAAKTGSASAFMDYYNYNGAGEKDDIITPAVDLTSGSNPEMTFEVAYQLYTDPNDATPYSDTLEVLISTDCGATWTSIYRKESVALTTTTPTFSTTSFVPTSSQWRMETINLSAYSTSASAKFMIRGICDYENQMYIDDINIKSAVVTGIDNLSNNSNVNIFPNPATDVINVLITSIEDVTEIVVLNIIGEVIYNNKNVTSRINKVDMSQQANGVYFVKVKSGDKIITEKVILAK
jgi:hypothetical protein